jgi:TP901-1 family phage major tail protein
MAAQQGRDILFKRGDGASPEVFTTVAGLTTKTLSFANGTLDITNDDDDGIRKLLAGKYASAFTLSASGVAKDDATFGSLRTDAAAGTHGNYQLVIPGATSNGTYEGAFAITSLEETGETDGAYTFTITIESADTIAFA